MCVVLGAVLIVWALALDGLTQPEATTTTGVLAICAAGVAFLGVHRQIRSNERINERNRAGEAERARRAELLEVVRDTITGMGQLSSSLIDLNSSRRAFVLDGPPTDWDENAYKAVEARLTAAWALLSALGQPALATELGDLLGHANDCVKLGDKSTATRDERLAQIERWYEPYIEAWARMLTALQQLLGEDSLVARPPASWNPQGSKYHRLADGS
ncbi:hypothetical protein [Rhodococcus maanshanensis]|uniref:hypothetical protein n=1 Tax=Rhodococcus maanshanensis TaxID=183556 RepID=UPI001160C108|nr:hypothetical protein [Rhodococcus maanshanensis]